jgi:Zn-dependent protease with chaperone function
MTLSLRWILAHELGHIKRKDHLVRWLEWLALVAFCGTRGVVRATQPAQG